MAKEGCKPEGRSALPDGAIRLGLPFCKVFCSSGFSDLGNLQARLAFSTWLHRSGLGPPGRDGDEPLPICSLPSPHPLTIAHSQIHKSIPALGRQEEEEEEGKSRQTLSRWGNTTKYEGECSIPSLPHLQGRDKTHPSSRGEILLLGRLEMELVMPVPPSCAVPSAPCWENRLELLLWGPGEERCPQHTAVP